ncbi:MAG TPA: alpha/beta hydrolase [Acidimicrobiales bacterium]|nr:alpha/beta hydrolase [Acidimicrobiales bacterium]
MDDSFVDAAGTRLHVVTEGSGPTVVLLHGWPEYWWSWRHQMPALAAAGFRAVAIDLPGFGDSDKPDRSYDEAWVNATIAGAIRQLIGDDERCIIAGHDWGGLLVWPFARRYPELLAGVVGVNTPDLPRGTMPPLAVMDKVFTRHPNYIMQFQDFGPADWILARDVPAWLEFMYRGPATRQLDVFTDDVLDHYIEVFSRPGAVTPTLSYYRNMDANWHAAASLDERIDLPALMICAEHDPVLTPAMSEGMEERVPDLERVTVGDCGHWTQQEQPEATNAALIGFCSRVF